MSRPKIAALQPLLRKFPNPTSREVFRVSREFSRENRELTRHFTISPNAHPANCLSLSNPPQVQIADMQPSQIAISGGPLKQLALPSEGKGHTFESCRVRHKINYLVKCP